MTKKTIDHVKDHFNEHPYSRDRWETHTQSSANLVDWLNDKNANLTITSSINNLKLCHELTRNFINVQDDLFLFEENEFHIKASLIIFFLSKKLELI